jgi:hypothetical protein
MRAADAHAQAELAELENVRERCLRSEAVWKEMAARAERTEQLRAVNEAEKWNAREAAQQVQGAFETEGANAPGR